MPIIKTVADTEGGGGSEGRGPDPLFQNLLPQHLPKLPNYQHLTPEIYYGSLV